VVTRRVYTAGTDRPVEPGGTGAAAAGRGPAGRGAPGTTWEGPVSGAGRDGARGGLLWWAHFGPSPWLAAVPALVVWAQDGAGRSGHAHGGIGRRGRAVVAFAAAAVVLDWAGGRAHERAEADPAAACPWCRDDDEDGGDDDGGGRGDRPEPGGDGDPWYVPAEWTAQACGGAR
jgi:hypothetical protein